MYVDVIINMVVVVLIVIVIIVIIAMINISTLSQSHSDCNTEKAELANTSMNHRLEHP